MQHPLVLLPNRPHWFWALLMFTFGLILVMNFIGLPLSTAVAPAGIVSFEIAGTPQKAQAMLDSWSPTEKIRAGFIQGLDFLFPLVYSTMLALACIMSSGVLRAARWPLAGAGCTLAWGQWFAAFLDYIENVSLLILLLGAVASPWPQIAAFCAYIKFALILIGMIYGFFGLAARLVASRK